MTVAHIAVDFRLRRQRGDGVNYDDVKRPRFYKFFADAKSLFAARRLRDDQVLEVHSYLTGVRRIQRVLGVDERRRTARFLRIGDNMQCERRFTRRLVSVQLDDTPFGKPSDSKRHIKRQRSRRNRFNITSRLLSEFHDRHLAEFLAYRLHNLIKRRTDFVYHSVFGHIGLLSFVKARNQSHQFTNFPRPTKTSTRSI